MDPGARDWLITIVSDEVTGRTPKGGPITEEKVFARAWASKADIRDSEKMAAQQLGATMTTRFRVEWSALLAQVDPRHRILLAGRTYDITGAKDIGTRDEIEFTTTVRTDLVTP